MNSSYTEDNNNPLHERFIMDVVQPTNVTSPTYVRMTNGRMNKIVKGSLSTTLEFNINTRTDKEESLYSPKMKYKILLDNNLFINSKRTEDPLNKTNSNATQVEIGTIRGNGTLDEPDFNYIDKVKRKLITERTI